MSQIVTDYHLHSVSPDARVPMREMCRAACDRGLKEIAVTDHMEFFRKGYQSDERRIFSEEYTASYFAQLEECRAMFEGRLVVRAGVELGQPEDDREAADRFLAARRYDFALGSIHKVFDVDLYYKAYTPGTVDRISADYLELLWAMADHGDYDVLAHFDLVKRYAARQGCKADLMQMRDRVAETLRRVAQRGKGLEINTSGLRQGVGETLPGLECLRLYRDLGGEILTVGSDAHRPESVGTGLNEARELALAAGFTKIATFEGRQPHFYSIA